MPSYPSFAFPLTLKPYLETQLAFVTELSTKACDTARQVSELNLHFCQQLADDNLAIGRKLLASTSSMEFTTTAMSLGQPMADRWRLYQQQLMSLLAGAQVEMTRTAEAHIPEASRTAVAMADELVRRASEETERATEQQRAAAERAARPNSQPNGVHSTH
jgi:phasin family protein